MPDATYGTYAEIKARLDEIVEVANDDSLPIDDALELYEEAVKLGLAASNLIEQDIEARDAVGEIAESADAGDESGFVAQTDTAAGVQAAPASEPVAFDVDAQRA